MLPSVFTSAVSILLPPKSTPKVGRFLSSEIILVPPVTVAQGSVLWGANFYSTGAQALSHYDVVQQI